MQRNLVFYIKPLINLVLMRLIHWCASLIPKSRNKVVMGAWGGRLFLDNPMYLMFHILKCTSLRVVWVGEEVLSESIPKYQRLEFAKRGSFKAIWHLLTSATWVCTHSYLVDLTNMPIPYGVKCINLWHGIPIKRLGELRPFCAETKIEETKFSRRIFRKLSSFPHEWLVVSSEKMIDIMVDGSPNQYTRCQILRTGTPRNDYLIRNRENRKLQNELKHKYSSILGFDPNKKIVLYFPTWRERSKTLFSFFGLPESDQMAWKKALESEGAILIEKYHHASFERLPPPQDSLCSYVVKVEQEKMVNAQEMLLMSDILVSDYSGAYIDFSLLQRPVIHFTYDFDNYAYNDDGFSYDLNTVLAGKRVDTLEELHEEILRQLRQPEFCPMHGLQDVVYYEQGHACELLTEFIVHSGEKGMQ